MRTLKTVLALWITTQAYAEQPKVGLSRLLSGVSPEKLNQVREVIEAPSLDLPPRAYQGKPNPAPPPKTPVVEKFAELDGEIEDSEPVVQRKRETIREEIREVDFRLKKEQALAELEKASNRKTEPAFEGEVIPTPASRLLTSVRGSKNARGGLELPEAPAPKAYAQLTNGTSGRDLQYHLEYNVGPRGSVKARPVRELSNLSDIRSQSGSDEPRGWLKVRRVENGLSFDTTPGTVSPSTRKLTSLRVFDGTSPTKPREDRTNIRSFNEERTGEVPGEISTIRSFKAQEDAAQRALDAPY